MQLVAEVVVAYLAWMEVMRLPTLERTVKIAAPAASHLVLHSYMQHSSRQRELTEIEPHPEEAQVYALPSQRALSTDLSLTVALPAENLE